MEEKDEKEPDLPGLDHDPEDEGEVDQVEQAEDVLGQPHIGPLAGGGNLACSG